MLYWGGTFRGIILVGIRQQTRRSRLRQPRVFGLTVSLAVTSEPATVVEGCVTLTGAAGAITIQAPQAGNGVYAKPCPHRG